MVLLIVSTGIILLNNNTDFQFTIPIFFFTSSLTGYVVILLDNAVQLTTIIGYNVNIYSSETLLIIGSFILSLNDSQVVHEFLLIYQ